MSEKPKVVIVDDEPEMARIVERWLQDDYETEVFESAEDLFERAGPEATADVIITDVLMPGLDGFALAERLQKDARFADTPVVFLTGVSQEKGLFPSLDAGGSAYLVKPIERVPLLEQVEKLLDRRAL